MMMCGTTLDYYYNSNARLQEQSTTIIGVLSFLTRGELGSII